MESSDTDSSDDEFYVKHREGCCCSACDTSDRTNWGYNSDGEFVHYDTDIERKWLENEKQKLWKFWHYEWAEHEFPRDDVVVQINCKEHLGPGVSAGYITVEDDVTIRFNTKNLIKHMRKYLPKETFIDHRMAMEEAGWVWS